MYIGLHVNFPDFNQTSIVVTDFHSIPQISCKSVRLEPYWYVRTDMTMPIGPFRRSHWPRGLRRRSPAATLLRLWVRIPPGVWVFACCECCVLSGRGIYDGLITRPEESYRLWSVVVCDQETSKTRRLKPATGLLKYNQIWVVTPGKQTTKNRPFSRLYAVT
jgi:hypothetical protein